MKIWTLILGVVFSGTWALVNHRPGAVVSQVAVGDLRIVVRETTPLSLPPVPGSPEGFDCNNAVFWDGGQLYSFSSHEHPFRSVGKSLETLEGPPQRVSFDHLPTAEEGGRWIESVYKVPGGPLYMWYHQEPKGLFSGWAWHLTAPWVGQMVSTDNGLTWKDQGIIIASPSESHRSDTGNRFFGGGDGDFTVIADAANEYLYFFLSTYHKDVRQQGVAMARLHVADLAEPIGKVVRWHDGGWASPGDGGPITPIFPVQVDWHDTNAQAFWGPAVHWNTHLKQYVMLLNRARNGNWEQDGVYISFNTRLDDPAGWSPPVKILDTPDWYPQVIGTRAEAQETDRQAGRIARLFVKGKSSWQIEFKGPQD